MEDFNNSYFDYFLDIRGKKYFFFGPRQFNDPVFISRMIAIEDHSLTSEQDRQYRKFVLLKVVYVN